MRPDMLGEWLHVALADLCEILARFCGAKVARDDFLGSWGLAKIDRENTPETQTQAAIDNWFNRGK
jgi:hypothetical protein